MAELPLPTFLIIGAQKSGTRWLRRNLGEHPEVFTYNGELAFFNVDKRFAKGPDWYRKKFGKGWSGESIVGEATPGYMMWNWRSPTTGEVAERIDEQLPDVRLIALLRNPVDRLYSGFIHQILHDRIAPDANLLDVVRRDWRKKDSRSALLEGGLYGLDIVQHGIYGQNLTPYVERFGERLRVFAHEDCFEDPRTVYRQALEHVGAQPDFVSDHLTRVINSYRPPTDSPYSDGAGGRRPLTAEERSELFEYFREDVEHLELLLDRDFSAWRPPRGECPA